MSLAIPMKFDKDGIPVLHLYLDDESISFIKRFLNQSNIKARFERMRGGEDDYEKFEQIFLIYSYHISSFKEDNNLLLKKALLYLLLYLKIDFRKAYDKLDDSDAIKNLLPGIWDPVTLTYDSEDMRYIKEYIIK